MKLNRRQYLHLAGAAAAVPAVARVAWPQTYPTKVVTVVVPFAVGGTTDIVARIVAERLSASLGTPTVVENRTGAGGVIGWSMVARAAPDGHTLLTTEMSFAIAAGLIPNLPFDPSKSFAQVTIAVSVPHVLVVHPSVKVKTVQEFIALAKESPGMLFFGSGGIGTNAHLGAELFQRAAGVKLVHVPYRGAGAVLQDLMGGQVQMLITAIPTVLSLIRAGNLRALMVTSEHPVAVLPDVPSATQLGLPQMVMQFWIGFAVPAKTAAPIVLRLNREIVGAITEADTRNRLSELGLEAVGYTSEAATRVIDDEIQRWSAVIQASGIKAN